jgi:hypothetical protein
MNTFSRVAIAMVGMIGIAEAQPKAEPRPGDPKPSQMPEMPEMKPPPELAELAKAAAGTWKCKGQGMDHTMKMADMTGTLKVKLELDSWWLHSSFESNMGKEPFHFESFVSFDATTKKWKRVMVESGGGWSTGETASATGGKVDWELSMHTMMGEAMFRDHEDASDPRAGTRMSGEFSPDKGKTWMPVYTMVCKK